MFTFSSESITSRTLKHLIDCLTLQKKRKILNTEGMLVNSIPLNSPSQWHTWINWWIFSYQVTWSYPPFSSLRRQKFLTIIIKRILGSYLGCWMDMLYVKLFLHFDWFLLMIFWRTDTWMTLWTKLLFLFFSNMTKIDSMLLCNCSAINHKRCPN